MSITLKRIPLLFTVLTLVEAKLLLLDVGALKSALPSASLESRPTKICFTFMFANLSQKHIFVRNGYEKDYYKRRGF